MAKIFESVTELVGATPLIRLSKLAECHKIKGHILGKCECYNPAFSIKDRIALNMLEKVPFTKITAHTVFVEATSGTQQLEISCLY